MESEKQFGKLASGALTTSIDEKQSSTSASCTLR